MAEDTSYRNLEGKRVSTTFRGLLHFPHSLDNQGTKQVVYDGQGTATALTLGTYALDVNGPLDVNGSSYVNGSLDVSAGLNVTGQTQINDVNKALILLGTDDSTGFYISKDNTSNKFEIGNPPYSSNNTKFCISSDGYIGIGTTSSTEKLQVEGTVKSYKNKIISEIEDHELLYGSGNLFSIIVKKDGGNNLYIKNTYTDPDVNAPLWINKATGEVNIRKLNVANIKSIIDPTDPTPPPPNRPDRNMNVLPVGMICMFPAVIDVSGWHKCDGTLYTYAQYPELGDFLGVTYGGTYLTNFKVPDYREVFLRGWGTSNNKRGIDPDVTSSTERLPSPDIQTDMIQEHRHTYQGPPYNQTVGGDLNGTAWWGAASNISTSYFGGDETRPKNIAVAYYIKW